MPIATGERTQQPEPKLGRLDAEVKRKDVSRVLEWNRSMKTATRGLRRDKDALPELKGGLSFTRLRVLPLHWFRQEQQFLSDGTPYSHSKTFPEVRSIQLEYPPKLSVKGDVMRAQTVKHTLFLPGRTMDRLASHFIGGYTGEDAAWGIVEDPNWCHSYVVWPITEEENAREDGLRDGEEFQDATKRRRELMEQVDRENKESALFADAAGSPMEGGKVLGSD